MLHLKQILLKPFVTISSTISAIKTDLKSLGVVPQNLVLVENLGILLLSLVLLMSISVLTVVTYILSRLADVRKSITSTLKMWQKRVWKEDGDLHQDSTFHYSEMRGGLENMFDPEDFDKQQKARSKSKKETLEDR